jgi:Rrf2 family protein
MFSKSSTYAIRAVLYLGKNSTQEHKVSVDTIAEKIGIPREFLAKILQQLTKHKLVVSAKGRNGGFYLSDNQKKSSLLKVIQCFDGPDIFKNCILGLEECSDSHPCPYHDSFKLYRSSLRKTLSEETVIEAIERIEINNLKLKDIL